jgi:ABC-2 type transport system ATP-binding protein
LIRLLSTQLRKTVLISSHILTELGEICDSAAIIEAGRILAAGTVEELQSAPRRQRSGRTALTVRVLGDAGPVERWLVQQPYVTAAESNGSAVAVEFEGDEPGRAALLRGLVAEGFPVLEFGGKTESLEDAFMAITKGIVQ